LITNLPEQLIEQAEVLLRDGVLNEANVRRAVSSAYYEVFHLLVRDAVVNWRHAGQHVRLARASDNKEDEGRLQGDSDGDRKCPEPRERGWGRRTGCSFPGIDRRSSVCRLATSAAQGRYDVAAPFQPLDAAVDVAQARLAFLTWAEVRDEPLAQNYLYSLLFKDRS